MCHHRKATEHVNMPSVKPTNAGSKYLWASASQIDKEKQKEYKRHRVWGYLSVHGTVGGNRVDTVLTCESRWMWQIAEATRRTLDSHIYIQWPCSKKHEARPTSEKRQRNKSRDNSRLRALLLYLLVRRVDLDPLSFTGIYLLDLTLMMTIESFHNRTCTELYLIHMQWQPPLSLFDIVQHYLQVPHPSHNLFRKTHCHW